MTNTVAIQGILGSFHHLAAEQYFGNNIKIIGCPTFPEIPNLIVEKKVNKAIMAIENSLVGAILPNYTLLDEFDLHISGEILLPIHHHLMCLPNQKLENINEVWSHPMAILQCRKFFSKFPNIKLVETSDTAASSKLIHDKQIKGVAAIASKNAASIYNLEIIEDRIQTRMNNYTRFFILKNGKFDLSNHIHYNKASLKFITNHQTGSLSKTLELFASFDLNLTKIQSIPIIDHPWEYAFFVDIIFSNQIDFQNAILEVKKIVTNLKILGVYLQDHK